MSTEKRGGLRQALHHKCWIVTAADAPGVLAHIVDISSTGAMLVTAAPQDLPDEFTLNLTEDGSVRRNCRISRRTDDGIGIAFLRAGSSDVPRRVHR